MTTRKLDRFGLYRVGREVYVSGRVGTVVALSRDAVTVEHRDGSRVDVRPESHDLTPRV